MKLKNNKVPKVLVTGVGAIIGYGIIKSLKMANFSVKIIGTDINPKAVGFNFADKNVVCPPVKSEKYCDFLIDLCLKENIALIIPGIEEDIDVLMRNSSEIESATGTKIVLNTLEVYKISRDKWNTYCFLKKHGLSTPETFLLSDSDNLYKTLKYPFLLKPRIGQAGKGIVKIENDMDFNYWKNRNSNYIAQELIGTEENEYTVGIFGKGGGSFEGPIIMRRKLIYGSTFEAYVDEFPVIKKIALQLLKHLKPVAPTNIQLRIDNGIPKILEINPRMSSSVSLRAAFGFNEAEMAVKFYLLGEKEFSTNIRKGFAQRYIEDIVFIEG